MKKVEIGNATLYCGDSFDILPMLDVVADAVISDPPFGITNCKWDKPIPLNTFWNMIEPRTKQSANYVLFGCGGFTTDLIISKRKWHRYDMIWVKSKKCGFLNANLMPMRNHESILVFGRPGYRKASTYRPQKTLGGRERITIRNHKSTVYKNKGEFTHVSDGLQHPSSVLYFQSEFGQHSTQKPIPLMEHLIKSYSNEGETVLDCFMGSGSTGVAAINTGRRFIGIERDEDIFNTAIERIRKANDELAF